MTKKIFEQQKIANLEKKYYQYKRCSEQLKYEILDMLKNMKYTNSRIINYNLDNSIYCDLFYRIKGAGIFKNGRVTTNFSMFMNRDLIKSLIEITSKDMNLKNIQKNLENIEHILDKSNSLKKSMICTVDEIELNDKIVDELQDIIFSFEFGEELNYHMFEEKLSLLKIAVEN
jgi:hypothetical protein